MRMLYSMGNALLSREELAGADQSRNIQVFLNELRDKQAAARIPGPTDTLGGSRSKEIGSTARVVSDFAKIGIGKPLSVEIREIYTGKYPRGLFGGTSSAMLMTTAMKNLEVFGGSARAVNFLTRKVKPRTRRVRWMRRRWGRRSSTTRRL